MEKEISKSLSGEDILKALDYKCNLVQYKDLKDFDSIEELLGPHKKCVLLYHTKRNYGHWTCLYEHDNRIYFFDSYGIIPDNELKFLHPDLKKQLNSQHRHLTKLLYNQNKPVEYNEYKLQKRQKNIATCGRHTVNRLRYPKISIDNYYKIFKDASKYMDMDELICYLVPI